MGGPIARQRGGTSAVEATTRLSILSTISDRDGVSALLASWQDKVADYLDSQC
jgi:hypothetical protein